MVPTSGDASRLRQGKPADSVSNESAIRVAYARPKRQHARNAGRSASAACLREQAGGSRKRTDRSVRRRIEIHPRVHDDRDESRIRVGTYGPAVTGRNAWIGDHRARERRTRGSSSACGGERGHFSFKNRNIHHAPRARRTSWGTRSILRQPCCAPLGRVRHRRETGLMTSVRPSGLSMVAGHGALIRALEGREPRDDVRGGVRRLLTVR